MILENCAGRLRWRLWLLCGLTALLLEIAGPPPASIGDDNAAESKPTNLSTPEERRAAFEWFSGLDYPNVKEVPFVRVATGSWYQHDSAKPPQNRYEYGFLLENSGDRFRVLELDFRENTYKKKENVPEHQRVGYEILDFAPFARERVAELEEMEKRGGKRKEWRWHGTKFVMYQKAFVFAWACWQRGEEEAATKIYDQAVRMKPQWTYDFRKPDAPEPTLQQEIAARISGDEWTLSIIAFGDQSVSRERLHARFTRLVKNFPSRAKHVDTTIAMLEQMLKEDEEHATSKNTTKPFADLSNEEQIAELIFQLREQPGSSGPFGGGFISTGGGKDTPADRLIEIGHDAVPQLIETLQDQRFSRAVGYYDKYGRLPYVMTVGECAYQTLEKIAGRSFGYYESRYEHISDEKRRAIKERIEDWYAQTQSKTAPQSNANP